MELSTLDRRILTQAAEGVDLVPRPFADVARRLDLDESAVLDRLRALRDCGAIKRFGLVVRHHELGYRSNAMVAWDLADDRVDALGARIATYPFVTLCYRRRRSPPLWPYNLFAMIHGKERATVIEQIERLTAEVALQDVPRAILFSRARFKQRGAKYEAEAGQPPRPEASWTIPTAAL